MKQISGESSKALLTEKTDIYALGGVFFKIITGLDPWLEYYSQYNQTFAERMVEEAKRRGDMPLFPFSLLKKKKKAALQPIYDSMVKCLQLNPEDRPTSKELFIELQAQVASFLETISRKEEEEAKSNVTIINSEIAN